MDNLFVKEGSGITLGEACAGLLLGQHEWIFRRVESIDFLSHGETRRNISFDFQVPDHLCVYWKHANKRSNTKPPISKQIIVPLTYMKKGPLTDFDLRDAAGAALPSIGTHDNGVVEAAALEFLAQDAQLKDADTVRKGVYCIIHSLRSYSSYERVDADADRFRHAELLLTYLETRHSDQCNWPAHVDECIANATEVSSKEESVEVKHLMEILEERIRYVAANGVKQTGEREIAALEAFLILISAAAESFVMTVLLPVESAMNRTIVKVSFDSSITSSPEKHHFLGGQHSFMVRFPTLSAGSSHLEVAPPEGLDFLDIRSAGTGDNTSTPKSRSFFASGKGRYSIAGVEGVKRDDKYHFYSTVHSHNPFASLHFIVGLPRGKMVATAVWTSLCTVVAFFCLAHISGWVESPGSYKFFTGDNALAAITLLAAVWAVITLTTNRHPLAVSVMKYVKRCAVDGATILAVSCLLLSALTSDMDGEVIAGWFQITCKTIIWGACMLLLIDLCWIVRSTVVTWCRIVKKRSDSNDIRKEKRDHAEVSLYQALEQLNRSSQKNTVTSTWSVLGK